MQTIPDLESQIKTDPFNPIHHIALARAYLDDGDEEKARRVIAIKRKLPSKDPVAHFEWGKLCEELGMAQQARESYEQAIALNPGNPHYHFRIALLYYEKAAWERALKHLQKTVSLSPQNQKAKEMLSTIYQEMGLSGSARFVRGEEKKTGPATPQTIPFELKEKDVSLFLTFFRGREVGYAQYRVGNTGGQNHAYVNGILGFNEIIDHIGGEKTFGIYPLRSDRTLKYSAIRIRIPWRRVVENIKNTGFLTLSEDKIHHYAKAIMEKARDNGISAYLENTGGRERRVWFFFEEFMPLKLAERFLNTTLDRVPSPGVDLSVDLLLGFKGTGIGWQDHPIMLPLGNNPKTLERCFFIDENGIPYEDQISFIKKIRTIKRNEIQAFLKMPDKTPRPFLQTTFNSLRKIEENCPVVEEIIRKAQSGRILQHDEKVVLYFTVGFLGEGFSALHHVLEPCPDYRPKKVDRIASRLGTNPISCPKIRELLPEMTAYLKCDCAFEIQRGAYPSPVLHIEPGWITSKKMDITESSIEEVRKEYLFICQKIQQLNKEKEELEAVLQKLKDNAPGS